jgi:hypothetical protein
MKLSADQIEEAIDADGAWNLLLALEIVLSEKAEHLRTNWQDKKTARVYDRFSAKCGALARELEQVSI